MNLFNNIICDLFLILCVWKIVQVESIPTFKDFQTWMLKNNKAYSKNELNQKFQTFISNQKLVQNLNKLYSGRTEFHLNGFADMNSEEFKEKILMKPGKTPRSFESIKLLRENKNRNLPDSFDWREKGAVTPVKDQGSVGTCWAFSTVQNLEGQYFLKGNNLTKLSVEQIVECDGTQNVTAQDADCGVFGGWPFLAFQYIQKAGGIASEDNYSYCVGVNNPCFPCPAPEYNKTLCGPPIPYCKVTDSCQAKFDKKKFVPNLKVFDWKRTSQNEDDIAEQLMNIGPLSVALNAELLQFYHKGVFDPISCDPTALDHAVLMVGWGVESKKPYWIIKNSWGTKWGESGYFRILRGKGKCGINTQVVTAILE